MDRRRTPRCVGCRASAACPAVAPNEGRTRRAGGHGGVSGILDASPPPARRQPGPPTGTLSLLTGSSTATRWRSFNGQDSGIRLGSVLRDAGALSERDL